MAPSIGVSSVQKKYSPGDWVLRPTRGEAEENEDKFWILFEFFRERMQLTGQQIADAIGYSSKNTTININQRKSRRTFTATHRKNFLGYVFGGERSLTESNMLQVSLVPDVLYFALLHHCGGVETSQDNARIRLAGIYKLWRFSVEHENEVILGRLDIEEDEGTHALKVRMEQPKQGRDGMRATRERASGYMYRLSNMYVLLLTDDLTKDLRITIFPRSKMDEVGIELDPNSVFAGKHTHVVHMDGFGLGVDGSAGFFSPVHLSLVDDADELNELDEMLDVTPATDEKRVPKRVREKLNRNGPLRRL